MSNGFESNVEILSSGMVRGSQVLVGGELMLGVKSVTIEPLDIHGEPITVVTIKVIGASLGRRAKKIEKSV